MKILYFSWIKDKIGKDQENVEISKDITTIADLIAYLSENDDTYSNVFIDMSSIRISINMKLSKVSDKISNQDEVAFFPPMTGG